MIYVLLMIFWLDDGSAYAVPANVFKTEAACKISGEATMTVLRAQKEAVEDAGVNYVQFDCAAVSNPDTERKA